MITIRGQLGSGAPEIGRLIADELQIGYVDREIIAEVAERLQRDEREVIRKEMPPGTLLGRIAEALTSSAVGDTFYGGAYLPTEYIPVGDTSYVKALEVVIRELANGPPLVIRGRGSQIILKDHPGALHVLVVAPFEVRLDRVMHDHAIDGEAARREISHFDTSRHEFVKRYFQADVEDPLLYDLVLNTGRLSFEAAASVAIHTLRSRKRAGLGKRGTGA